MKKLQGVCAAANFLVYITGKIVFLLIYDMIYPCQEGSCYLDAGQFVVRKTPANITVSYNQLLILPVVPLEVDPSVRPPIHPSESNDSSNRPLFRLSSPSTRNSNSYGQEGKPAVCILGDFA